jgi:Reverse transcriptase (RNA-dependent DNA polymerase)
VSGLPTLIGPYDEPASRDAGYYWRLRREHKSKAINSHEPCKVPTLRQIVNDKNLMAIFDDLKHNGGQAQGADRIAYADVSNHEVARIVEQISKSVLDQTYQPYPGRKVKIPKSDGVSYRELTLRSIFDRLIATALHRALDPMWESIFDDRSMAWRPHRSHHLLLARLERDMIRHNAWILTTDDVKQAFDYAHIPTIMRIHERYIRDQELLELVETVLKGGEQDKRVGIDQGCAYSPTAMNVLLNEVHDRQLKETPIPAWNRYGDNLAYAT